MGHRIKSKRYGEDLYTTLVQRCRGESEIITKKLATIWLMLSHLACQNMYLNIAQLCSTIVVVTTVKNCEENKLIRSYTHKKLLSDLPDIHRRTSKDRLQSNVLDSSSPLDLLCTISSSIVIRDASMATTIFSCQQQITQWSKIHGRIWPRNWGFYLRTCYIWHITQQNIRKWTWNQYLIRRKIKN